MIRRMPVVFAACLTIAVGQSLAADFDADAVLKAADQPVAEEPAKILVTFKLPKDFKKISLSPDGKWIAAIGASFQFFNAGTGKPIGEPKDLGEGLESAEFSSQAESVVFAGRDKYYVVNGRTGGIAEVSRKGLVHMAPIDEKTILMVGMDGTVLHRSLTDDAATKYPPATGTDLSTSVVAATSPDRRAFTTVPLGRMPWMFYTTALDYVMPIEMPLRPNVMVSQVLSNRYSVALSGDGILDVRAYALSPNKEVLTGGLGNYPVRNGLPTPTGRLAISSDEKWLMCAGPGGFELRPLDSRLISAVFYADLRDAQTVLAPTAMRAAALHGDQVTIYQLPLPAKPLPSDAFISQLFKSLEAKRFEDLDALGKLIAEDAEPFPWAPDQSKYNLLVALLASTQTLTMPSDVRDANLLQWFRDNPDSDLARLVLVRKVINKAWSARGDGLARTVSKDGWRVFNSELQEANDLLEPLLEDEAAPLEMYTYLFEIAKGQSWPRAKTNPHVHMLLKRNPKYLSAHIAMSESLLRRWGGEPGEDQKYIARVGGAVGGRDGDAIYAQLATKLAIYEQPDEFFAISGFDYERILSGWTHLQSKYSHPDYGVVGELFMAHYKGDAARVKMIAKRIEQDHLHYVPGILTGPDVYEAILRRSGG